MNNPKDTKVNGSAMPVDIFINLAQDYAERGYDHQFLRNIFSVNREVQLEDLVNFELQQQPIRKVAEPPVPYRKKD